MQNTLNEPIEVLARFRSGNLMPLMFRHNSRLIKIDSVDLKYSFRKGLIDHYSFSVSANGNSYKITYNGKKLEWVLEEIWSA